MIPQEVDVIVVGGGPAGCATAGRLARADPNLQVLLLEGGPNNEEDPSVYRPGVCAYFLRPRFYRVHSLCNTPARRAFALASHHRAQFLSQADSLLPRHPPLDVKNMQMLPSEPHSKVSILSVALALVSQRDES
jgi:choline dehydrogenase-like flavoprotein